MKASKNFLNLDRIQPGAQKGPILRVTMEQALIVARFIWRMTTIDMAHHDTVVNRITHFLFNKPISRFANINFLDSAKSAVTSTGIDIIAEIASGSKEVLWMYWNNFQRISYHCIAILTINNDGTVTVRFGNNEHPPKYTLMLNEDSLWLRESDLSGINGDTLAFYRFRPEDKDRKFLPGSIKRVVRARLDANGNTKTPLNFGRMATPTNRFLATEEFDSLSEKVFMDSRFCAFNNFNDVWWA